MKRVVYACLLAAILALCAQAALAQLADSCWPKFHKDYAGTGQGLYGGTGPDLTWTFTAGAAIKSSPIIGPDGTVYFTCDNGRLYAVTGGGVKLWEYSCNALGSCSPAISADGTIYVAASDLYIYAIKSTGVLRWKRPIGGKPVSSIAIGSDGTLYIGCENSKLYAMTPDGYARWNYSAGGIVSSTPAIGSDGTIYFGCADGKLYALYSTGSLRWKFTPSALGAMTASPTIGSDGTIYIGAASGYFYAVHPDGGQGWRASVGGMVQSSAAVFSNGSTFFGSRDGKVHAVSSAGTTLWTYPTGSYVDSSPAVGSDGSIYVGSLDGKIYSFGVDGSLRWSYDTGSAVYSSPAIGPAGALFVGSNNGVLYCFAADSTPPSAPTVTADGPFNSLVDRLHGSWIASDPESGIYAYEYCIGTAPGLDNVAPWAPVGSATQATRTGLSLVDKQVYYITARATNGAGLVGPTGSSPGITIDASPPTLPQVVDDGRYTATSTSLHATWSSQDPESGIAGYQYSIGTTSGGTDAVSWTDIGMATSVTRTGLTLRNGSTYYINVKALNGGRAYSAVGSSDGITVDTTPPPPPVVVGPGQYMFDPHAISVNWSCSDNESGITQYEYSIGTEPGGTQVRPWTNAGTSTGITVTGLNLANGQTYFVNVRAINGALLVSDTGSSTGSTLDSTPPTTPVVVDDGAFTASLNELHASWSASDPESGIKSYRYAIGTTAGGTDILGWTDAGGNTSVTLSELVLADKQAYYFSVIAANGAGAESSIGTSDGITVDATPPTRPVVTDDGATTFDYTQLHATWVCEDKESGLAKFEYSIGTSAGGNDVVDWTDVGLNTSVTKTGLVLQDLSTYYINVRAYNTLGALSEVGSSDGIMVDSMSPPAPTVTDDGSFTFSLTTLHAVWTAVTSPAGVASYEYSIGTTAGATDVKGWTNVGLITEATATDLTLVDKRAYFINARAISSRGRAGIVGSSDGITVDATVPTTPVVTDGGAFTGVANQLQASWSAADPESGIVEYKYAVGTTAGGTDTLNWTSAGTDTTKLITPLTLADARTYYISVKAKNGAGAESAVGSSDGIMVDLTPPTKPTVTDDGNYTTNATQLHATWSSADPQSGVVKYEYSIGKSAGATDVLAWTSAGTATSVTATGLSLMSGPHYFVNVRATNGAGLVSLVGSSDGIFVETTPPTTPVVTDGGAYTKSTTTLTASWTASDPESGVASYQYSIGKSVGATDVVPWTNAGTNTSVTRTDLTLQHGKTYYFNVKATNGAGLVSLVGSSDGILVDTTPPSAPTVTDGGAYTADPTKLVVTVAATDAESGIGSYEYAVGTTSGGTEVVNWTRDGSGPSITISGLSLAEGVTYYISARATNGAGIVGAAGTSDGIMVDVTPPVNLKVTDDGEFTGDGTSLHGTWSASDPQSGVAKYRYCIGTAAGLSDTAGWLDVGTAIEHTRTGLSLTSGKSYYITVVAVNGAGGESAPVSSDGIKLDLTPPTTPVVTDSGKYWGFKTYLSANWTCSDPESGVTEYQFSIGTSAGAQDTAPWQSVGTVSSYTRTSLMLSDGVHYYVNIKAKNGAGKWSVVGSSDGILVDSTPPTTPVVIDDGDTTSVLDRLHCTWKSQDPESGVVEYVYCIGTSPGAVDVQGWTSAGANEEVTVTGLQLDPVLRYYFSVKAKNDAGAWSAVSASDGIGFSSGAAIWGRFRNDSLSRGRGLFGATTVNDLAWTIPTQGYVESSPAIAVDGTTYVGSGDGKLYAVTQNGTVRWTYDTGSSIDSSPAIAPDGSIVFGCNDGKLYCLSAGGDPIWQFNAGGPLRSSPLIANGLVYVGGMNGSLYAIGLANGSQVWKYAIGEGIWSSPAIDANGVVYFCGEDAYLYAINANGTRKWRFATGSAVDSSPAIASDGTIYFGSGDGGFYAVNPDGTQKWRRDFGTVVDSSAAIGPDGNIYVEAGVDGSDGTVYALRPNGTDIWHYHLQNGGSNCSPAVDPNGMVYVGSSDGHMYAFNPNGTVAWKYATGSTVASSPALGADSSVVFGSYDGAIYCLRDVTSKDLTPPTTPVVHVPGSALQPGQPLVASWSATDPESMVAEYTYAVGTAPGLSDVMGWTSAGIETSISRDDLGLELGKTYYVSVKARNPSQRWSGIGTSSGVTVMSEEPVNLIGAVRKLADGAAVAISGKIVTGVFADCFFIEESDRSAGIRCVQSGTSLHAGDVVDVTGTVSTANGEKAITIATQAVTGTVTPLAPMGLCGGMQEVGLDPTGLYVTIWGKVAAVQSGFFVIDQGAALRPNGAGGIAVPNSGDPMTVGGLVAVRGVLCREQLGGSAVTAVRSVSPGGVTSLK